MRIQKLNLFERNLNDRIRQHLRENGITTNDIKVLVGQDVLCKNIKICVMSGSKDIKRKIIDRRNHLELALRYGINEYYNEINKVVFYYTYTINNQLDKRDGHPHVAYDKFNDIEFDYSLIETIIEKSIFEVVKGL